MKYSLNNDFISISINDIGAELISIKTLNNDKEHIWTADPKYWDYHAPTLFPIIGGSINNKYILDNNEYTMPPHGFLRNSLFICEKQTDTSIVFSFTSNLESKKLYPFDFKIYITYTLKESTVKIDHKLINNSINDMYFFLGAHPGFLLDDDLENYIIRFEKEEYPFSFQSITTNDNKRRISKDLLPAPFEKDNMTIKVNKNLFDIGVYIFNNLNSNEVSIINLNTKETKKINFKGFPYLGIWAVPNSPFICIEPWYGISSIEGKDDCTLKTKPGVQILKVNDSFECSHSICLK